jgi:ornithine carbamoyltransferase
VIMRQVRHFLSFSGFSREELLALLTRAREIKGGIPGPGLSKPLEGRCVGLLFEKPSTRTRVSFHVGVVQLGGHPIFLNASEIQMHRGEPIRDTARVLSRYLDAVVIRTHGHDVIEEFSAWSTIPVINALTDTHHPCQIAADIMTLQEAGLNPCTMRVAWIGDGNNVSHSWIEAAEVLGFTLTLACPEGYEPLLPIRSPNVRVVRDPAEAVRRADAVSTDVWASMGQENEAKEREKAFQGYQVNDELLGHAGTSPYILHCLPAHRGEEITDEVMESKRSLVWDEAENRLHAQKAILEMLVR